MQLRYDHVVRLTCFRPTGEERQQEFIVAWNAATLKQPRDGIVYRELCRQVPEWSKLAEREIDNPIEATFLEYLVVEPQTDLSGILALPTGEEAHYSIIQDLHTIAFQFTKEQSTSGTGALMFNLFKIDGPAGMEQGFLMDWPPRGEFKIKENTTQRTVLHQRMLPGATIKAFNRAEVRNAAEYVEGTDRFEAEFPRAARKSAASSLPAGAKPPIRSHLGLFEIVALGPTARMRAAVVHAYGGPDVIHIEEIDLPKPGPGQVRIKIRASSVNPLDVKMRSGDVRHIYPPWFPDVLGYSVSGTVDAVGEGVTARKTGEEVYGINNPIMRHGYAEYVVAPAGNFYPKPARMDFATAAAAPSIFATAYGGLFLRSDLKAGQTVVIHGGAGVIGSCAVQLAKQAGARVIATASGQNVERVRNLGADVVADYKTQRFEDFAKNVDLVLDTVGGETRERSWELIRRGGALASLLPPPPDPAIAEKYGVRAFMVHGHPEIGEIMPEMTRRLESGKLAFPEIAARYPLEEVSAAHAAFEKNAPKAASCSKSANLQCRSQWHNG